jgi:hypothetical protein
MQQFDTQFIDRFMQPLLMRIFTDIAEGKDNIYLQKLLAGEEKIPLLKEEKEDFIEDYFLSDRTKPFSTTSEEDEKFQYAFIDSFADLIRLRSRLSGVEGTKDAFFPDDEKKFDVTTLRNIYDLSYKVTLLFEKAEIEKLIESKKEKGEIAQTKASRDKALLEAGRLKLINVNGEDQYISEEEARKFANTPAGDVEVIPLIAIGTSGTSTNISSISKVGKTADEVLATISSEDKAEKQIAAETKNADTESAATNKPATAESANVESATATKSKKQLSAKPKSAKIAELSNDFKSSKKASIEMMMEKNGLEVLDDGFTIDEKGIAHGRVKDAKGQILIVETDTLPNENDPQKYELRFKFTFADDSSKNFILNQTDLNKFLPDGKTRKTADEVGFGIRPEVAGTQAETSKITAGAVALGGGIPSSAGTSSVEAIISQKEKLKLESKEKIEISGVPGKESLEQIAELPKEEREKGKMKIPRPVRMPVAKRPQERERFASVTEGRSEMGRHGTIMEQKKKLAERPVLDGQQPMDSQMPQGPRLAYAEQPQAAPAKTKKSKMPLVAAIATGGSVFVGVGGIIGAGMNAGSDTTNAFAAYPQMLAGTVDLIMKLTHFFT